VACVLRVVLEDNDYLHAKLHAARVHIISMFCSYMIPCSSFIQILLNEKAYKANDYFMMKIIFFWSGC
jgi:hypothetical protein